MGLDNGIVVKLKGDITWRHIVEEVPPFMSDMPARLKALNDFGSDHELEVCYWRKHWGIRSLILNNVCHGDKDEYEYQLDLDDIKKIISIMEDGVCSEGYHDEYDDYWEYEGFLRQFFWNYKGLLWLRWFMENFSAIIEEVYFYDSY